MGLANVSESGGVEYDAAAQNEDPIHFRKNTYVRLGGTGGGWRVLTAEGAGSFKSSSA